MTRAMRISGLVGELLSLMEREGDREVFLALDDELGSMGHFFGPVLSLGAREEEVVGLGAVGSRRTDRQVLRAEDFDELVRSLPERQEDALHQEWNRAWDPREDFDGSRRGHVLVLALQDWIPRSSD